MSDENTTAHALFMVSARLARRAIELAMIAGAMHEGAAPERLEAIASDVAGAATEIREAS